LVQVIVNIGFGCARFDFNVGANCGLCGSVGGQNDDDAITAS
jgi:hypothetical protein